MAKLNAYVNFDGNCREAMTFYKSCLGGELKIQTVGDAPAGAQMPGEKDKVMHSDLTSDKFTLFGSDFIGPHSPAVRGNMMNLCLICSSKQEIEFLYSKLSAGGKSVHPLKEEFFGTYGDIIDKFGVTWLFQFSANQTM